MPLSKLERKKYSADMKAKKAAEGYATGDPSCMLLRKVKRMDMNTKVDLNAKEPIDLLSMSLCYD